MNKSFLIALGAIIAIIIGFLAPQLSIPAEIRPVLWGVAGLLLVAFFLITYLQSRPEQESNFKTLWPKLSESLHQEIQDSLQSIQEAIHASQPGYVYSVNLVGIPNFPLYSLHLRTVNRYDPDFGKTLRNYVALGRALREAKNTYNQLSYQEGANDYTLGAAKQKMYKVSRDLERLIDEKLQPLITRYDNEIPAK